MFKDELNGMSMAEFCAPRTKTYAFRHYDDDEGEKIKERKKENVSSKTILNLKFIKSLHLKIKQ